MKISRPGWVEVIDISGVKPPGSLTLPELPWPPSVNHYWMIYVRNGRVGRCLSRQAKSYRATALQLLASVMPKPNMPPLFSGLVGLELTLQPPDSRRRDLDNTLKALLDCFTSARIWADDSQCHELSIRRLCPHKPDGRVLARLWQC